MKKALVALIGAILLAPVYAGAQIPDNIVLLDNFGEFSKGQSVFIYGNVGAPTPNSFLILKITNPLGDICQIQQILPLQDGSFITSKIPLRGNLCGISGTYGVQVFYGDDRNSAEFTVSSDSAQTLTSAQYSTAAQEYVDGVIDDVAPSASASNLKTRLSSAGGNLDAILLVFKDAISNTLSAEVLYGIDASFRPAVDSYLSASDSLERSSKITSSTKTTLTNNVIESVFYYQIGQKDMALDIIYRTYGALSDSDPTTDLQKSVPYADLESSLLNLMQTTGSALSRDVQEEVALIFSRGQGPLYADELERMLDMLTKTRFLDVILLKNDSLYSLINTQWESERLRFAGTSTMSEFLEEYDDVAMLYDAAVLLRGIDSIERFIDMPSGNAEVNLVALIEPEWEALQNQLLSATSASDILDKKTDIESMKSLAQIAKRITKAVSISQNTGIGVDLADEWTQMLSDVGNASSISQILLIVSEFDTTITELREKRDPLAILTFEYKRMKEQAERQADYNNLVTINEIIKVLDAAAKLNEGAITVSRTDRTELLLTWASDRAPIIRASLDAYTDNQFKERAGNILQSANSLKTLVELGIENHRFDVGFIDYTDSIKQKIERVQNLIIAERLYEADQALDALHDEWQTVLKAYSDNPDTTVGFNLVELRRIEYQKVLDLIILAVDRYSNAGFAEYREEYNKMISSTQLSMSVGNFEAVDTKIRNLLAFLSNNLDSTHKSIIYDVQYDPQPGRWAASGYLDKDNDIRVQLYLHVYDSQGVQINSLEFGDTKTGKFNTFWNDKVKPGLYAAVVTWDGATSTKFIHVQDPETYDSTKDDPELLTAAKQYEIVKSFLQEFGGAKYIANAATFNEVIIDIEDALSARDHRAVSSGTIQLQLLAERYLPQRDKTAVIDVVYSHGDIRITGAVKKIVPFSEDLYVDVYDETGDALFSLAIKDSRSGYIDQSVSRILDSGLYTARLSYHDLVVSDFFSIN